MKITIGNFCLAAGGGESPADLSVNGQRTVQVTPLLGAAFAGVFPRGNRVNTITFSVTRAHASDGGAESFLFAHAATLPASGSVAFLCEDADGTQVRYLAETAAVASDHGMQRGNATIHKYTLVCGAISGGSLPTT